MAGSKITMPSNGSTDWSDFVTITQHSYRHMQFVSFTNTTSTGAPAIEAGSYGVVNGTMYSFTPSTGGSESISTTGLSTGFVAGNLWVKAVPTTGDSITAEFTTTAPTWSAAKGGYYSTGNDKYIGGVAKSTRGYGEKWAYEEGKRISGGNTRPVLVQYETIGVWDMQASQSYALTLPNGLVTTTQLISLNSLIRKDLQGIPLYYDMDPYGPIVNTVKRGLGFRFLSSTATDRISAASLYRVESTDDGFFESINFDDTTIDRGHVVYTYRG